MTGSDHITTGCDAWDRGDLEIAFRDFLAGAEAGDAGCQVNLGFFYDQGLHVQPDNRRALFWYRQAYLQGDCSAARNIATVWRGRGVHGKALWWFRRAATLGDGDALVEVARIYEQGIGVRESIAAAVKYYRLAAEHNHITPEGIEEAEAGVLRCGV